MSQDGEGQTGLVRKDGAADVRPRVFLSYARGDRPRIALLAQALQTAGLEVWWDAEIKGGDAFADSIETALDAAEAVVVAWSQTSVASDWVRDEAGHGRDRKRLVPVSLDGTLPPLGFRQYHSIDLSQWQGGAQTSQIAAVVAAVHARRGEAVAPPPQPIMPQAPLWSRRNLMLAAGAAGVAVLGGGLMLWRGLSAPPVDGHSVAVQTFKNFTGDPQQQYFSDGLSDDLRAALARDNRLKVMGQSSTTAAGNDAQAIARALGVAFVLNGGVERAGDQINISAHLTNGSGQDAWAQTFPGKFGDIFTIQGQIAAVVLAALTQQADAAGKPGPVAPADGKSYGGTTNVDAYQAYLKGREMYQRGHGEASDRAALAQFEAAVAADPAFAVARSARARSLASIASTYALPAQARTLYDQAFTEAAKAVSDAPESAYIQSTLGKVLAEGRLDVRAARAPFEKALALGTNDATALTLAARFAAQTGQSDAALNAVARAQDIDPLNPLVHRMAGLIHIALRQFDQALAPLRQSLALQPDDDVSNAAIGLVYLQQGRLDDALKAWQAEPDETQRLTGLAIVQRRMGQAAPADAAFAALVKGQGDGALYQQAQVKAQWGEANEAMALLQHARTVGDAGLLDLKTDVLLDPLRPDPRFDSLLSAIGFS
jgi:TolB-like protein/tetratricopeptide (TPR) repeat protein